MKNLKKFATKAPNNLEGEEFRTALELFCVQVCGEVQSKLEKKKIARPKNAKPRSLGSGDTKA